ncbi:Os12g0282950 [Oryza sativa Japonica Group]|uniref:Os12g0282950 protein n=1 Tax=Oryza sativa subsp. japonica TaxID=39947 RepID=A0A0P0Y969_ORYSJ|nr:Os12g0282950 [Oryza sativa Japonica Group]
MEERPPVGHAATAVDAPLPPSPGRRGRGLLHWVDGGEGAWQEGSVASDDKWVKQFEPESLVHRGEEGVEAVELSP